MTYRQPVDRGLAAIQARAAHDCSERRRRVLAHPDIAADLTRPPLSYSRADAWTGYVPPAMWNGVNDSPRRAALIAILRAVTELEAAEEAP